MEKEHESFDKNIKGPTLNYNLNFLGRVWNDYKHKVHYGLSKYLYRFTVGR